MTTQGVGLPDKPWRDVGDPTARYVRVPCAALTDLERKRGQFQYRDRIYRVIAHDLQSDVYGAELISSSNAPAGTVNEQLVDTVRKQLRIHLADDPFAEKIALATAAAIEEHHTLDLLESATVLRLQPGDTIVFRTPDHLTEQQYRDIHDRTTSQFPGHKVAVLEGGLEIGIIRPDEVPTE